MQTKVLKINKDFPEPEIIKQAVDILSQGGLVVFPTETVYGLGANSQDKNAVEKLYQVKNRPKDKSFTLLISSVKDVGNFASDVLPVAYRLMDKFWPGPLTVILKSKDSLTVGLRIPKAKIALEIVKQVNFPIACPSANLSGNKPPLNCQDVLKDLDGKIDLALDGGQVELGVVSTVVDATKFPFRILRQGFVDENSIQEIVSRKRVLFVCGGNSCRSVMAKALLEKKLKEKGRLDIEVFSAGMMVVVGTEASPETKELLRQEGVDISSHRAQRVTDDMLKRSDLILVMERSHEENILQRDASFKKRLYLLKEFSQFNQGKLEIEDPIGNGMQAYKNVFLDIKVAVERLVDLI